MTTFRSASLMVLLAICSRTIAAAELVVIGSNAEGIEVGAIVDGAELLELPPATRVTFISAEGQTVEFEGPYRGTPLPSHEGGEDPDLIRALSKLLGGESGTGVLAAFRSVPGSKPDLWTPNVTRSGTYCVRPDRPVALWRKRATARQSVTLELIETGEKATRSWPAGERLLAWPSEVPLLDAASYFLRLEDAIGSTELTLLLVPSLPNDAHRAAWMGENGCERQARRLLEQLAGGKS